MVLKLNHNRLDKNKGHAMRNGLRSLGSFMKKIKLISIGIMTTILLTGCAARYNGPGTFQDFAKARYECYESLNRDKNYSAYIGEYGGSASSSTMPSCGSFVACLASRGYIKSENGRLDTSSIQVNCRGSFSHPSNE